jgi:hypothetical protein
MRPDAADLRLLGGIGLLGACRGAEVIAAGFAAWQPQSALAGMVRARGWGPVIPSAWEPTLDARFD